MEVDQQNLLQNNQEIQQQALVPITPQIIDILKEKSAYAKEFISMHAAVMPYNDFENHFFGFTNTANSEEELINQLEAFFNNMGEENRKREEAEKILIQEQGPERSLRDADIIEELQKQLREIPAWNNFGFDICHLDTDIFGCQFAKACIKNQTTLETLFRAKTPQKYVKQLIFKLKLDITEVKWNYIHEIEAVDINTVYHITQKQKEENLRLENMIQQQSQEIQQLMQVVQIQGAALAHNQTVTQAIEEKIRQITDLGEQ